MSDAEYSFISSTMIKNVARLGGDISHCTRRVEGRALKEKYKEKYINKVKSNRY